MTPEGEDAENELTHLILEAAHRSKTALNVVVRLHDKTPEDLYLKVADLHYRGTSSISLMNDRVSIEAMKRREFTDTDANDYAITGCVDMCAPGRTGGIGFSALLLARILDITLRNGDSRTLIGTVRNVGLKTGDPDGLKTFDELFCAFIAQAVNMIELIVRATQIRDRFYAEKLPAPYISAFMDGCLEKRKDVTAGGSAYDMEGILFMNSIANVVDSLFVIKKLAYEGGVMTVADILEAVDHNFTGYEDILEKIEGVPGK